MTTKTAPVQKPPVVTDKERRRRQALWEVYCLLLDSARPIEEEAADGAKVEGPAPSAAEDAAHKRSTMRSLSP